MEVACALTPNYVLALSHVRSKYVEYNQLQPQLKCNKDSWKVVSHVIIVALSCYGEKLNPKSCTKSSYEPMLCIVGLVEKRPSH